MIVYILLLLLNLLNSPLLLQLLSVPERLVPHLEQLLPLLLHLVHQVLELHQTLLVHLYLVLGRFGEVALIFHVVDRLPHHFSLLVVLGVVKHLVQIGLGIHSPVKVLNFHQGHLAVVKLAVYSLLDVGDLVSECLLLIMDLISLSIQLLHLILRLLKHLHEETAKDPAHFPPSICRSSQGLFRSCFVQIARCCQHDTLVVVYLICGLKNL